MSAYALWCTVDAVRLTILGSGTMMPTENRYPAAYLLDAGSARVLLDCGFCAVARLVERNIALRDIEAVCVSHFHTDHFGDLLPLVHALWVDNRVTKRTSAPLTVLGPPTIRERWKKLREVFWPEPEESFPVQFIEGPTTKDVGPMTIEAFDVTHVPWFPSEGFRISADGKTLVYTGDIGSAHPMDDLVNRARGADLLLIEAGALAPAPNHLTIEQVVKLGEAAGVKRVVATHIRDRNLPAIRAATKGRTDIIIAEDGMVFDV